MFGKTTALLAVAAATASSSAAVAVTTLHVPATYPTIQDAINASYDGDTILVSPGTYTEGINFGSREIEVRSTKGAEVTIIDPPSGRCFTAVGQEGPDAILEGFTLTGGSDTYEGGGVYIFESSPTLIDCVITGNAQTLTSSGNSTYGGGGVYVDSSSNPTMVRCVVSENTARHNGGGIHVRSSLTLTDCIISGNSTIGSSSSAYGGGGVYVVSLGVVISGGVISGNTSNQEGGGIYGSGYWISISDCLITGNVADENGGGLARVEGEWTNCVIEMNDAAGYGGAMYLDCDSPVISGCEVRNNSATQCGGIWVECGTPSIGTSLFCGNGVNISGSWSDQGDNIFQGKCDGSGPTTRLVPFEYATIQAAIDACFDGDEVLVAPGTYSEGINFGGRAIAVRGANGAELTIIDPPSGRCFTAVGQETPDAILEGFTLTGGSDTYEGGGVYIFESSPTLIDCVITGNAQTLTSSGNSTYGGGGVYVDSSSNPTMVRCVVSENTARHNGGGIHVRSSLTLTDCIISGNSTIGSSSSAYGGGGVYVVSLGVVISGGVISGNTSNQEGGGIYGSGYWISISDCLITGNVADENGGGLARVEGEWTNCVIEMNDAAGYGGAMYLDCDSPVIKGCEVRNNSAVQCGGIWVECGTPSIGTSLFCGNGANICGSWSDQEDNVIQGQCDPFCIGDVNGDTWVNGEDLGRMLAAWGACPKGEPCYADFDGDGTVSGGDLGLMLGYWGRCPGWE